VPTTRLAGKAGGRLIVRRTRLIVRRTRLIVRRTRLVGAQALLVGVDPVGMAAVPATPPASSNSSSNPETAMPGLTWP